MEGDFDHGIIVRIVVLDQFFRPKIEYLDFLVPTAGGDAGSVRVESCVVDHAAVVLVGLDLFFAFDIPNL